MVSPSSPRIRIEARSIQSIHPYSQPTKLHSDEDIRLLASSIERFGFNDPIGVDENGTIIEGHGRYRAALQLNIETVPVIVLTGLTDKQKRLYRIAHNKIALSSTFDFTRLAEALSEIIGSDISAEMMGFADAVAANLTAMTGEGGIGSEVPVLTPVEPFEVIWESAEQKAVWNGFMKRLKARYPDMSDGAVLEEFLKTCGVMEGVRQDRTQTQQRETIHVE